jgi:hypothetical protein
MMVTSERFDPSSLTRHFLGSTALSNAFLWHIEPRHEVYHITVYKVPSEVAESLLHTDYVR